MHSPSSRLLNVDVLTTCVIAAVCGVPILPVPRPPHVGLGISGTPDAQPTLSSKPVKRIAINANRLTAGA